MNKAELNRARLLRNVLDIVVSVGEVRLKLEDIMDKFDTKGLESDIRLFEGETATEAIKGWEEEHSSNG